MHDKLTGEGGVEGVEECVIVVADHGGVQAMEKGMFKVALGVPNGFNGFSARDSSAEVRVGDSCKPGLEVMEPGACFNAIKRREDGEETMLDGC